MPSVAECYGTNRKKKECGKCEVKKECRESARLNAPAKESRINTEVALALQEFAELPEVYQDYAGDKFWTYDAILRVVCFLSRLSAPALRVLRLKIAAPDAPKSVIAKMTKVKAASVKRVVSESPAIQALFNDNPPSGGIITPSETVYLSGPISGMAGASEPVFADAEQQIAEKYRCTVINPTFAEHFIGFNRPESDYMILAAASVKICDVVVLLPGWEQSAGSQTEKALAEKLGKRVLLLEEVV